MDSYIDADPPVNVEVDAAELEISRFLSCCPAQATAAKRRRRVSPEMWSTFKAHLAREYQSLPPDSPRIKPTLAKLRLLGKPEPGSAEAA